MGYYMRNPKCKGKKVERSKYDLDPEFKEYNIKISFAGVDKCLDAWDDIARNDFVWGQCRSWKDATKRKHQWFRHIVK